MKKLLINFAGIGDLVILIPLLRKLAEDAELDILTRPYGPALFKNQSFITKSFGLAHPNRGKTKLSKLFLGRHRENLVKSLMARNYDEIYYFSVEKKVIIDWVNSWRGKAICRPLVQDFTNVNWIKKSIESQEINPESIEPYPRIEIDSEQLQLAKNKLSSYGKRVVGIQVGSGKSNTKWKRPFDNKALSTEQWGFIATHILSSDETDSIVFHGTANESRIVEPILKKIPKKFHDRIFNWTKFDIRLEELCALLAVHYAFISVDTGPAHIAAAVGCPLLVFFGPTNPDIYLMKGSGPVEMIRNTVSCQPCYGEQYKNCRDNICLNNISAEDIVNGWESLKSKIRSKKITLKSFPTQPSIGCSNKRLPFSKPTFRPFENG